jgi:hypothetical protein
MRGIQDLAFRGLGAAMAAYRFRRLRRADPPPLGLVSPPLHPVMLGGEAWDHHGLLEVTLVHGDPLDTATPLAEITTSMRGGADLAPEQALAGLIHRDTAAARGDWAAYDDGAAADLAGPVTFSDTHIRLGGKTAAVTALSDRHYRAAGFAGEGMTGTIATRHCPLDRLSVAPVTAIDPYLDGYLAFLQRLARTRRSRRA